MEEAETHDLRVKHEADLKRAIKKLQRYRENLRAWAADSSVKQKQPLQDARRAIEKKMEAFKTMEQETKNKTYSRAGMTLSGELDEEGLARKEARDWLSDTLATLMAQSDELEADIEIQMGKRKTDPDVVANLVRPPPADGALQARCRRPAAARRRAPVNPLPPTERAPRPAAPTAPPPPASPLSQEEINASHKFHIERIEQLTRLLDNRDVTHDEVTALQDDLTYYVEDNREPEFMPDLDIYDAIPAMAEALAAAAAAASSEPAPAMAAASASASAAPAPAPVSKARAVITVKKPPPSSSSNASDSPKPSSHASSGGAAKASSGKGKRAAEAAAPAPGPATRAPRHIASSGASLASIIKASTAGSTPEAASPSALPRPISASAAAEPARRAATTPPAAAPPATAASSGPSVAAAAPSPAAAPFSSSSSSSGLPPSLARAEGVANPGPDGVVRSMSAVGRALFGGGFGTDEPFGLGLDFGPDDDDAKAMRDPAGVLSAVERSLAHVPETHDLERARAYVPRNPIPAECAVPAFQVSPLPVFDMPSTFARFSTDTLLFAFYFQQGTPHQAVAARQLLQRSWRFHSEYGAWFQRYEGEHTMTETHEAGPYKFFDYENTWAERVLDRFEFRYDALTSSLQ